MDMDGVLPSGGFGTMVLTMTRSGFRSVGVDGLLRRRSIVCSMGKVLPSSLSSNELW